MGEAHIVARRRASSVAALLVGIFISGLIATSSSYQSSADDDRGRSKLDKESRERLASAIASGDERVMLLLATKDLQSPAVVSALQALGAVVRFHDEEFGYVRASVPTDKVDQAANIPGVLAAEVDFVLELPKPLPEAEDDVTQVDPPGPATPPLNPYMPTRDIGAPQFVAANPTFDGRGITIGIVDTGADLDHPALQTTTTGKRKVVDWVSMTHPVDDNDPTWVLMSTTVEIGKDGAFTVGDVTYSGAPTGTFRFGVFNENSLRDLTFGSDYNACPLDNPSTRAIESTGGDLNRNGVCGEKFALLWDEGRDMVLVDTDADKSFADEQEMRPYKKHFDIGHFGTDNPTTPVVESVPFVAQVSREFNAVNIGIVTGAHGTHVAGIAAGHGFFNGAYHGAAPGAQIVSVQACRPSGFCTAHGILEGIIYAVKVAKVDVVNMSIGGLPALNDGNNPRAIIINRLIDSRAVQMFFSAGNSGPGVNTVGDPSVATKVMSVGASWSQASVLANYGSTAVSAMALHDFSSRGPREDGFTKPQIVAPGNAVSSIPLWNPLPGAVRCLPYACPPGFALFNGTSMSAPQATGAAALLLAAARQSDVPHKPVQLRQALMSSAQPISGYKAHEQGAGLINVGAAWTLLGQGIKTHDIVSSVATNTILSPLLATPGIGTGIHERENRFVGQSFTRTYTFTKLDGGHGTFNVSFVGDTGAFSASASTLTLAKDVPATLDVTFNGQSVPGAYSALLQLDDPATVGVDYQIMNTVLVSSNLGVAPYTVTGSGSAKRFEASGEKFFFQIPPGTVSLEFSVTRTNVGRIRFTCTDPRGIPLSACTAGFFGPTGAATQTRTLTNPLPGSWEMSVVASRAAGPAESTFTVAAKVFKVTFDPASWTQSPTVIGTEYAQTFTATNQFASGVIGTVGGVFASTRTLTATISAGDPDQVYDFTVPSGSLALTVSTTQGSDPLADLDVFVFHCPGAPSFPAPSCVLKGSGLGPTTNETVTVPNPPAGQWFAVVTVFNIPAGSTTYGYTDSILNPAFGSVSASTPFANRASGSTFTVNASSTALTDPGPGRFLRASILARLSSATGPVVGAALVDFRDVVTP